MVLFSFATDVVVVKRSDGSFRSTPMLVTFGKLAVVRPAEKMVRNFTSLFYYLMNLVESL
jgi:phosphatidate phosphatase PAH1